MAQYKETLSVKKTDKIILMLPPIILAPASKNRENILRSLNIPFRVKTSKIDERRIKETNPSKKAKRLAFLKAKKVAQSHKGIIIAADTFTVCQNKMLEKPKTIKEAKTMLCLLSKKTAMCYTGFCYLDNINKIEKVKVALTKIQFREIGKREIRKYIRRFPVVSWAAAYAASELYVLGLIRRVYGSLTGLTHGLPLEYLIPLLKKSGYQLQP